MSNYTWCLLGKDNLIIGDVCLNIYNVQNEKKNMFVICFRKLKNQSNNRHTYTRFLIF